MSNISVAGRGLFGFESEWLENREHKVVEIRPMYWKGLYMHIGQNFTFGISCVEACSH